jgi:hypothetical protein
MENQKSSEIQRITIAEAIRLVKEGIVNHEGKNRFPDHKVLYVSANMHEEGNEPHSVERPGVWGVTSGKDIAIDALRASFMAFSRKTGVVPRNLHNPWGSEAYTGEGFEDFTHDIAYGEFQMWAAPYMHGATQPALPLPIEEEGAALPSVAAVAPVDEILSRPVESSTLNEVSWKGEARKEADKIHFQAAALGYRLAKEEIAEKVADNLAARGIEGPGGPLTAGNILREAIQGGRWKRPKSPTGEVGESGGTGER